MLMFSRQDSEVAKVVGSTIADWDGLPQFMKIFFNIRVGAIQFLKPDVPATTSGSCCRQRPARLSAEVT